MKFRKSHRKEGYDYSTEGYYFITICTHFKEHTLATIIRTERELNLIRLYISLNPVLWREHAELSEIDLTEEKIAKILDKFRSKP